MRKVGSPRKLATIGFLYAGDRHRLDTRVLTYAPIKSAYAFHFLSGEWRLCKPPSLEGYYIAQDQPFRKLIPFVRQFL